MKLIRELLFTSTLGLAAVEATMDDTISTTQPGRGGAALTASLDATEAASGGNGGPASALNSDEDKPHRAT